MINPNTIVSLSAKKEAHLLSKKKKKEAHLADIP